MRTSRDIFGQGGGADCRFGDYASQPVVRAACCKHEHITRRTRKLQHQGEESRWGGKMVEGVGEGFNLAGWATSALSSSQYMESYMESHIVQDD